MGINITSDNIAVYPSTRRGERNASSRLLTEQALVSIVNKLIDKYGFVITKEFNPTGLFEFNIYGYYFKVRQGNNITNLFPSAVENDKIYGIISISSLTAGSQNEDVLDDIYELEGQDADGVYSGVEFSLEDLAVNDDRKYSLPLLIRSNNSWVVYPDSLFKFDAASMTPIIDIDGGTI